eukprot:15460180-Alexandrium_andersonii.AAC.1
MLVLMQESCHRRQRGLRTCSQRSRLPLELSSGRGGKADMPITKRPAERDGRVHGLLIESDVLPLYPPTGAKSMEIRGCSRRCTTVAEGDAVYLMERMSG